MDYLGPHEPLLENLDQFTRGEIYRKNGEQRNCYMGQKVIDMSLIRMHYARGEISDRSFKCIDYNFFKQDTVKSLYNPHDNEKEEQKSEA